MASGIGVLLLGFLIFALSGSSFIYLVRVKKMHISILASAGGLWKSRRERINLPMTPLEISKEKTVDSTIIFSLANQAITLVEKKFQVSFGRSSSIQEMVDRVTNLDSTSSGGRGAAAFASIFLTMQDYLYSKDFNESRIKSAEEAFKELSELWGD